jgi:hypothetical protein
MLKGHGLEKAGRTHLLPSHAQLHKHHVCVFVITGIDALLGSNLFVGLLRIREDGVHCEKVGEKAVQNMAVVLTQCPRLAIADSPCMIIRD